MGKSSENKTAFVLKTRYSYIKIMNIRRNELNLKRYFNIVALVESIQYPNTEIFEIFFGAEIFEFIL